MNITFVVSELMLYRLVNICLTVGWSLDCIHNLDCLLYYIRKVHQTYVWLIPLLLIIAPWCTHCLMKVYFFPFICWVVYILTNFGSYFCQYGNFNPSFPTHIVIGLIGLAAFMNTRDAKEIKIKSWLSTVSLSSHI